MKFGRICALVAALTVISLTAADANIGWNVWNKKQTSLSVFAAMDTKSSQSGYGAAVTMHDHGVTDLSYVDMGDFRLAQFSKLAPKQIGPYSAQFGFALGHSSPKEDGIEAPDGLVSGLSLIMSKTDLAGGLALDLRASSLSKDFDPIKWLTEPDVLWIGAGLSYTF